MKIKFKIKITQICFVVKYYDYYMLLVLFAQLDFKEVFTENKSTKVHECIHDCQQSFYKCSKNLFYNIFGLFIGIPLSFIYGFISAIVTFIMVWYVYPVTKYICICYWPILKCTYVVLHVGCMLPCADAMSRCVRHFQFNVNMKSDRGRNNQQAAHGGGGTS